VGLPSPTASRGISRDPTPLAAAELLLQPQILGVRNQETLNRIIIIILILILIILILIIILIIIITTTIIIIILILYEILLASVSWKAQRDSRRFQTSLQHRAQP
jgi:hypothetical protein